MKTKIFVISVLVLLVEVTFYQQATAQQRQADILVAGEPPLTQATVDKLDSFFEWALDLTFTNSQRNILKTSFVNTWQKNDRSEIESTMQTVHLQEGLSKSPAEERAHAREQVQPLLLKSLQMDANDEISKMLLAAYNAAHAQNTAPNGQANSDSRIIGKWYKGTASSTNYYNPSTGQWSAPSGSGFSYEIFADGRYIHAGLIQSSMYSCTMTISTYEKGTWRAEGGAISFSPASASVKSQDNCNKSFNYEKPKVVPARTVAFSFKPNQYTGEEQICFAENDGEECFRRGT